MPDRFILVGWSGDRKFQFIRDRRTGWIASVDMDDCDTEEMARITQNILNVLNSEPDLV